MTLVRSRWQLFAAFVAAFFLLAAPQAHAQPTQDYSGRWSGTFQWDGEDPGTAVYVFNRDGTFSMEGYDYTGRWRVNGNSFWMRIDQPPSSVYSGTVRRDGTLSGTIRNDSNDTGTFTFVRAGVAQQSGGLPDNFDVEMAQRVLNGDRHALLSAFVFGSAPQGHAYWYSIYESDGPLPAEARAALQDWVSRYRAGERPGQAADVTPPRQPGPLPQGFEPSAAREAMDGNNQALLSAFVFSATPQGHAYWYALYESQGRLPADAYLALADWIARYEAGERPPGEGGNSGGGRPRK